MLGPESLVLCSGSLPQATLEEKIAVAAEAGFDGLSIFYDDFTKAREAGRSVADLAAMIRDRGLEVAELDPLMHWLPGGSPDFGSNAQADRFIASEAGFYEIAEALGGRSINAVVVSPGPFDMEAIGEAFARLCDRAADHGLLVHLEFLPWSAIPNIEVAAEVVAIGGRTNGGVMLDTWHHFRSGVSNEVILELAGHRILGVQLNDAPREPADNLVAETLTARRIPGEGDIDLVAILRDLRAIGCTAPLGVEVFSSALANEAPIDVARRLADATRAVVARSRN